MDRGIATRSPRRDTASCSSRSRTAAHRMSTKPSPTSSVAGAAPRGPSTAGRPASRLARTVRSTSVTTRPVGSGKSFTRDAEMPNPLHELNASGQSIWLDNIDRKMLHDGSLKKRVESDALTGMTSNPTIFEKALAEGTAYDEQIGSASGSFTAMELFELVETTDVRNACDIFKPVYDRTKGKDGFVSIEVSPGAANDARATIAEAQRLWKTVDRPNVMIKIPGTT